MKRHNSFHAGKAKSMLQSIIPAVIGTIVAATVASTSAMADVPEYWVRETFKTEKSTMTASLQSDEERPSRTREVRASVQTDDERPTRPEPRVRTPRPRPSDEAKSEPSEAPKKQKPVRTASLGKTYVPEEKPAARKSVGGGGGINWIASAGCLNGELRGVLSQVASRFGSVTVNSTCRSPGHNRNVGGASKSWHLTGDAADFRIHGNWGAASSFLRSSVGGFKHYGGGLFHIDTGPKRSW